MIKDNIPAPFEVAQLIEQAKFEYEKRIEHLRDMAESAHGIVLDLGDDETVELSKRDTLLVKQGILVAIRELGDFPLSLDKPTYSYSTEDKD